MGYDVSVLLPSAHSLGVMEGNQVSARRGRSVLIINRAMYLCNPRVCWREIAQEMAWPSRHVQRLVYFRTCLQVRYGARFSATKNVNLYFLPWNSREGLKFHTQLASAFILHM